MDGLGVESSSSLTKSSMVTQPLATSEVRCSSLHTCEFSLVGRCSMPRFVWTVFWSVLSGNSEAARLVLVLSYVCHGACVMCTGKTFHWLRASEVDRVSEDPGFKLGPMKLFQGVIEPQDVCQVDIRTRLEK